MLKQAKKKFAEPYPVDFSPACYLRNGLISGAFVLLFFVVNKPFGLAGIPGWTSYILYAGYALITFGLVALNHLLFPNLFRGWFSEERWTTGKHILFAAWIMLSIGFASYLFTRLVFRARGWSLSNLSLPIVLAGAFFIGTLLLTFLTLLNQNVWLRRNARTVSEANTLIDSHANRGPDSSENDSQIELVAENEKDTFRVRQSELIYIQAEENYVEIHYKREGRVLRFLLRSSLTRVEEQLQPLGLELFRCHRAYIVNIQKIYKVSGNAQGLRLTLRDVAAMVPVARRYVGSFRARVLPRL